MKNIKSYPLIKDNNYDGYNLQFSEVKAVDVEIQKSTHNELGTSFGDLRFKFFGKLDRIETYSDFITVIKEQSLPKKRANWEFEKTNRVSFFDGCLTSFGVLAGLIPVVGLLFLLISIGWIPLLFIIGFILLIWLFSLIPSSSGTSSFFNGIGNFFTGIISFGFLLIISWTLLSILINSCTTEGTRNNYNPPEPIIEFEETVPEEQIIELENTIETNEKHKFNDSIKSDEFHPIFDTLLVHKRVWKDFRDSIHKLDLVISKRDIRISKKNREKIEAFNSYGGLYNEVSVFNSALLERTYQNLDSLRITKNMGDQLFAEAVVSMIQDIPYKLILDSSCSIESRQSKYVQEYLNQCSEPCCLGNIKFGFQSPAEFLGNLYGDCDTRTLLVFTILKHFDYDVGIINSDQYAHSMIAINLPYNGAYKKFNNKRYIVWETTNVGFPPGFMAPEYGNMNLWDMVLTSK